MMKIIGHQPVLWIAVISLLSSGRTPRRECRAGTRRCSQACKRYPNMRVYDWPDKAKRKWFIPDGIHYYSPGYVARTHDIAQGLVHAFPRDRPPAASCLVQ